MSEAEGAALPRIRMSVRRANVLAEQLWAHTMGVKIRLVPSWSDATELARSEFTTTVRAALAASGIDIVGKDERQ